MGFNSFLTADTRESIRNRYVEGCRTVYMLQPGGEPAVKEEAYEGYGEFGGVDAYLWLARRNLPGEVLERFDSDDERLRSFGCEMENTECAVPLKFSFDPDAVYEKLPASERDPSQGYFTL